MKYSFVAGIAAFAGSLDLALAQTSPISIYGQCGGIGYTGSTTCATGLVCTYLNDYFYQCLYPSSTTTTTVSTSTTTSKASTSTTTSKASTTTTTTKASTTTSSAVSTSTGYIKTSGTKFTLNGSTWVPVGTNAYWMAQLGSQADVVQAFSELAAAGYTVLRTEGFNDVTTTDVYGVYYQYWANGVGTLNTGANGIPYFDFIVATAKTYGIHLIVALTNNWSDYGGMDVYTSQIVGSGQYHDVFYTNANVIAAYKKYISEWVSRYLNEPTIMAWELANEPRCAGTSTTASPTCNTTTITNWASNISSYIKSIDPNHLVALGDEGFFNQPSSSIYVYQGSLGIDFVANLAVKTLDFGTFHMYPESWGESADPTGFGNMWITDHASAMKNASKPVIVEEYGVTIADQATTYQAWADTIVSTGLTGELVWQSCTHLADGTFYYNDAYCVYNDSSSYATMVNINKQIKAAN